jgi:hypothetical protein
MLSYIYPSVFARNAVNLTQLLPRASKIRNRNFKQTFLGTFLGYIALTLKHNSVATSAKLVGTLKKTNNFYVSHFSIS